METHCEEFRNRIAQADERLRSVPDARWSEPYAEGSWLRKEVLGHLIDSAANNHLRFVSAALNGTFQGPGYDQNAWVAIHRYRSLPPTSVLSHWRSLNSLLCAVVDGLSAEQLQASCRIGDDNPLTLNELVRSYLEHLDHHVGQIVG